MKCKSCDREFQPRRKWQAFCTKQCRYKHHNDVRSKIHASTRIVDAGLKASGALVLLIPNFLLF